MLKDGLESISKPLYSLNLEIDPIGRTVCEGGVRVPLALKSQIARFISKEF